jgi:hypothetical protein
MKKIHIKVTNGQVDAFEPGNPQDVGNIIVDKGETISWKHQENTLPNAFIVTFVDEDTHQPGWPFIPTDPSMRLTVPSGSTIDVKLDPAAALYWKYKVDVENNSNIKPHDPMIIIRGRFSQTNLVLATGVGLLVGAFVTWLLLRPSLGLGG